MEGLDTFEMGRSQIGYRDELVELLNRKEAI